MTATSRSLDDSAADLAPANTVHESPRTVLGRTEAPVVRREDVIVPEPMRARSSGSFAVIEVDDVQSRPGPLARRLVLATLVIGALGVLAYAWDRASRPPSSTVAIDR